MPSTPSGARAVSGHERTCQRDQQDLRECLLPRAERGRCHCMSVESPAVVRGLAQVGRLTSLAWDVTRLTFRRPFQVRELVQQCWFFASVTILPTALVSIPFGAVIALQLGSLTQQIGAQSFIGAASALAIVQQASPLITALLVAGAGGSAMCADIGSRKIREEIDALEVLGVNPIQRLIVPRVLAAMVVAMLLNG